MLQLKWIDLILPLIIYNRIEPIIIRNVCFNVGVFKNVYKLGSGLQRQRNQITYIYLSLYQKCSFNISTFQAYAITMFYFLTIYGVPLKTCNMGFLLINSGYVFKFQIGMKSFTLYIFLGHLWVIFV